MSDDGEGPLSRWSRLKRRTRDGEPTPEAPEPPKKRGGAAPVTGRRLVRSMPPLAGAEQDSDDPYAAPPIVQAYGLPPEPVAADETVAPTDDNRELTSEEQEAIKDLPPIDSLNKESDFTPFLADKVPDFIRRKALSVLWRSDPVLANLDGLNDYDEDFTFAAFVAESLADAKLTRKMAKAAEAEAKKRNEEKAASDRKSAESTEAAEANESVETADAGDDVGEADGDVDGAAPDQGRLPPDDAGEDADDDRGEDLVRPPGTPPRRH